MKTKNIFVTREIAQEGLDLLREQGYRLTVSKSKKPLTKDQLRKALSKKKYDAVVTLLNDIIDKDIFDTCPSIKLIANYAVGFNNIDIEEATARKIRVTNTRGTSFAAVAEHTVALLLALSTRLVEGDAFTRKGKYKGWDPALFPGIDVRGRTVGIIGAGAIGRAVGNILCKGFDCNIIYTDEVRNESFEEECGARLVDMEYLMRESDIVSVHVPLLETTHHLINRERIHMMKKTAILINTSRGPVVDEKALVEALQHNVIYGAGLDVYEHEPELAEGLAKLHNVVITPHISSARPSARIEMSTLVAKNIISFFEKNGEVLTPVN